MKTTNSTSFCKQASCPSAATLMAYRTLELEFERDARVGTHLAQCDFCCAELQLLSECPVVDDCETQATEIPLSLRRLAEEILAGSFLRADMFVEAGFEKERLTLTDA